RHGDLPGRVDLQARALRARRRRERRLVEPEPELGGAEHAALLRRDDTDPDVAPLGPRTVALGDPARVVGRLEDLLDDARVVAAVLDVAGGRAVGELVRADEVPTAEL